MTAQWSIPHVSFATDRELEEQEREQLVRTFRDRFVSLNTDAPWDAVAAATKEFEMKVKKSSPAYREFEARQDAFLADEQRRKDEAAAKQDAAVKLEQERQNAALKSSHLHTWLSNGGTESEFEQQWPAMRLRILEEQTLSERNARLAATTPTWRG